MFISICMCVRSSSELICDTRGSPRGSPRRLYSKFYLKYLLLSII